MNEDKIKDFKEGINSLLWAEKKFLFASIDPELRKELETVSLKFVKLYRKDKYAFPH